ncbi:condensation domain-containing protein [Nonomuraea purpurea]|uniref:Condensation domain-containing protein n=1 Tax=Nonomuraea purpurea TaxID=1849276 RepID=A0ABV8GNS4_9ACTN
MDDAAPTGEITVAFRAPTARSGLLTWAQREMWHQFSRTRPHHYYFNSTRLFRVPEKCRIGDVTEAVRRLVECYEAFRTTIGVTSGGVPRQHVAGEGVYRLALHEAGEDEGGLAERLSYEYRGRGFDDDEWPLRVAVITRAGEPALVLFTVSHLAADRVGLDVASEAFVRLLAGERDALPATVMQPLDQVAVEDSPVGERAAARAVAYWERTVATIPHTMFPDRSPAVPGNWSPVGVLRSPAAGLAAAVLGAELGVSPGGAVLAAAAALLSTRTGNTTVALGLFAANRSVPGARDMVSTCVQPALFSVDVPAASFRELIRSTWTSSLLAYRHAWYPPDLIGDVVERASRRRGQPIELDCQVQDYSGYSRARPIAPSPQEVHTALPRSRFSRSALWTRDQLLLLTIAGHPGSELRFSVASDPAVLPVPELERFVRGIELLLVRAVVADFELGEVPELTGLFR